SPTHDLTVKRKAPEHVVASWTAKNVMPLTDFTVYYQDTGDEVGASILLYPNSDPKQAGHFLMMLSPNFKPATGAKAAAKDIVLVLDKSGSMSGKKIRQACEAASYILKRLNPGDRFNIIPYSDAIEPSFTALQPASEKMIKEGIDAIDEIQASGGTNIAEALAIARKQFDPEATRPKYVIFLTDGLPTVGKTDQTEIIKHIAAASKDTKQRMFVFGVGYDVNVKLLDKLAIDYKGRSDYVKPNEPVERKVTTMYNKIRNPLLTNLKVSMPYTMKCSEMYPRELGDLYDGDQIVVAGRYKSVPMNSRDSAILTLTATAPNGKTVTFKYNYPIKPLARGEFIARLWATRRIGWLMDQIQLNGENKELTAEVVKLSKEYGILTPYTSFLADDRVNLARSAVVTSEARRKLGSLAKEESGAGAQMAAKTRQSLNYDAKASTPAPVAKAAPGWTASKKMKRAADGLITGNADLDSYEANKKERVNGLRQVGNQAIYQRGRVWIAANATHLDPKKDESKIKTVKQYSEEYFKLSRANTRSENAILASQQAGEELLVAFRGQAYRITP
ncbi:MAG: VWA domain-containing protein, partial [Phycisphaerales bacterium]|nr:VWA domain-containing protein [Phycisphaerales bacterium]